MVRCQGYKLDAWGVWGVFFFLSWFSVPAPPLLPSLLSVLAVHNLIKHPQHNVMIRMLIEAYVVANLSLDY